MWRLNILSGLAIIGFCRGAPGQSENLTENCNECSALYGNVEVMILYGNRDESSREPTLDDEMNSCAGSLVRSDVVLTAAHCVNQYKNEKRFTLLTASMEYEGVEGSSKKYSRQQRWVRKMLIHEKYDGMNNHRNDFAILFAEKPFDDAANIRPLRLRQENDEFDGSRCVTSGLADARHENGHARRVFKKIDIPTVPRDKCQESLKKSDGSFKLDEGLICAGGEDGVYGRCLGAGGAAIVCPLKNDPSRYIQVGIILWAQGCRNFGVHPDVRAVRDWIDEKIAQNKI